MIVNEQKFNFIFVELAIFLVLHFKKNFTLTKISDFSKNCPSEKVIKFSFFDD